MAISHLKKIPGMTPLPPTRDRLSRRSRLSSSLDPAILEPPIFLALPTPLVDGSKEHTEMRDPHIGAASQLWK